MTKKKNKRQDLTQGDLKKQIFNLTLPMILGMLGMTIFNFVDALYIGMLGELPLAAISFTFPVVMIVGAISQGLAMGAAAEVSAYAGKKNETGVQKSATYALMLAFIIVAVVSVIGHLTIDPLFRALGATDEVMPYIEAYMRIWYYGMPFVVFPMVGNNIIRALGDTKLPGFVMLFAALLNAVLDPILIFGVGFKAMGISGAALATVISRFTTFTVAIYILSKREKVLRFAGTSIREFFKFSRDILYIGVPTSVTRGILPLGSGVLTALIATFGASAVAGYGAGVKLEFLFFSVVQALSTVMVGVAGQNFGAKQYGRIKQGYRIAAVYALVYSFLVYPIIFFVAPLLSQLFDVSDLVRETIVNYVRVAALGAGFYGVMYVSGSVLNAIKKPFFATGVYLAEMFVFQTPLAYFLSSYWGVKGVFIATVSAYILGGAVSYLATELIMKKSLHGGEDSAVQTV